MSLSPLYVLKIHFSTVVWEFSIMCVQQSCMFTNLSFSNSNQWKPFILFSFHNKITHCYLTSNSFHHFSLKISKNVIKLFIGCSQKKIVQCFSLAVKGPLYRSHDIHKELTWVSHSHSEWLSACTNVLRHAQSRTLPSGLARIDTRTSNCFSVTPPTPRWTRWLFLVFFSSTTTRCTATCKHIGRPKH